jgi:hypothetical protein
MKTSNKKLIFFSYFIAVFLVRVIRGFHFSFTFLFFKSFFFKLIAWLLGAALGGYFIKIEQLFYAYIIKPNDPSSLKIKELAKQRQQQELWKTLRISVNQQQLAFRSALFQTVWVVLAFFAISSTAGYFGKALVMGIGLHLLIDEWECIKENKSLSWLFWQIKRPILLKEQKLFLYIISTIFVFLTLLLI